MACFVNENFATRSHAGYQAMFSYKAQNAAFLLEDG